MPPAGSSALVWPEQTRHLRKREPVLPRSSWRAPMFFLVSATVITATMLLTLGVGAGEAQAPSPSGRAVDAKLTVKIKTALWVDQRFFGKQIRVDTVDAVATLRGKVDSDETKTAAADIAQRTEGVAE